jgi:hypothetical protein
MNRLQLISAPQAITQEPLFSLACYRKAFFSCAVDAFYEKNVELADPRQNPPVKPLLLCSVIRDHREIRNTSYPPPKLKQLILLCVLVL